MPVKTKEEMKEYNHQLYLKRKERKQNASVPSLSRTNTIELIITELPEIVEQEQPFIEPEIVEEPIKQELETIEEIMKEFMLEMFEEEKDEIIEGTVKYMYYKLYLKIHHFQKMYKKELSPEYRGWIYNWRNVNKEFYENQL